MKYPGVIPTAEPFFYPGDRTGCLLIHGFTGTPKEMHWLGEYLADQGHTVLGVRLAGHATQPADMLRVRWEDWVISVEDGWHMLSNCTDRVVVMGLSMGGVLALLFASHYPTAGVVAMSTPHHLPPDPRMSYIKILSYLQPSVAKGSPDWRDPAVVQQHVDYPDYPTRAIAELRDLLVEMRSSLPEVKAPVLLIYSTGDLTIRPEDRHTEQIYASLGSQDKQVLWVENSGHVVTEDAEREKVFQSITRFITHLHQEIFQPANFVHDNLEFLPIPFRGCREILKNLAGEAADEHQGVFDLMADMGRHLAQDSQALAPKEFILHAFPFPQVLEMADHADLPVVFIEQPGGKPDGHERAVPVVERGFKVF